MKNIFILLWTLIAYCSAIAQSNDSYERTITFPGNFQVGDFVEFVQTAPLDATASGYYEVSVSYVRGNIAAAATHIASISHANANIWREAGRVNANDYVSYNIRNFTIDCNGALNRFRIRAVANHGLANAIPVHIKIRSVNFNTAWTSLETGGNDVSAIGLHPMTNEWSLYTGNVHLNTSAHIAIYANNNGNVGIGTKNPTERLSVKGKIRAQEIKVEANNGSNWPDYVFKKDYPLPTLADVEKHINEKGHLPEVPSAEEVKQNGIEIGSNQALLLKKIEELTLYIIELNKTVSSLNEKVSELEKCKNPIK